MSSTPRLAAISKLRREIEALRERRALALRSRRKALVAKLSDQIRDRQAKLKALQALPHIPMRSSSPTEAPSRDPDGGKKRRWYQVWKAKRPKSERRAARIERKDTRRELKAAAAEANDKYASVEITAQNAKRLAIYYRARSLRALLTPKRRAYFRSRLQEALSLRPGGRSKVALRRKGAVDARRLAAQSRARRDYASATRYDERATRLEQEARILEIQSSADGEEGSDESGTEFAPYTGPRRLLRRLRGAQNNEDVSDSTDDADASEDGTADTAVAELPVPFYKRPAVLAGAAIAAAVLAVLLRPKGAGTAGTVRVMGAGYRAPRAPYRAPARRPTSA